MSFLKNCRAPIAVIVAYIVFALVTGSNAAADDLFSVRKISYQKKMTSVTGAFSSGLEGLGNIGGTAHQQWGVITVSYDSEPSWADDVDVKYYVLTRDKRKKYHLFTGHQIYVSVPKGIGHAAQIFIHPNALIRYGQIKRIMVEIWYKGILITSAQWPTKTTKRWWTQVKAINGILRPRFITPFLLDYEVKEEAIKVPTLSE
ncbi:MAG: hypothetical protein P9M13_10100 [Candidatus Ancaeobacter aquaticus]|nr:hypothetical protein [Candidatus Ancaeobacter aquaticus]